MKPKLGNPFLVRGKYFLFILGFFFDFCDRGLYSLEVILLLFALKVKYPDFIYLIRGHHEDININEFSGF